MTTTDITRISTTRLLSALLVPLLVVGTLGAGSLRRVEAAQPSTQPATRHSGPTSGQGSGHGVSLTISSGTSAEYRAREQLTFFSFPTDAVGTTSAVSGRLVLDAQDRIVPSKSTVVIDLRTLKSDRSQRDQFIQANTLQTAQYPQAVFHVTRAVGLPAALPATGTLHFSLAGALTVHGVTRPTTWTVTATLGRHSVTGVATTHVKLTSFGMSPPQVGPVLSVNDTITLEISARLARAAV